MSDKSSDFDFVLSQNNMKADYDPGPLSRHAVHEALEDALKNGDADGNKSLSQLEFNNYRKSKTSHDEKETTSFVDKHFGALSVLNKDNILDDTEISAKDLGWVRAFSPEDVKGNHRDRYHNIGYRAGGIFGIAAGTAAQIGDVAMFGGTATFMSSAGHVGLAAALPLADKKGNPVSVTERVELISKGAFWGPYYGRSAGRAVGVGVNDTISDLRYDFLHAGKVERLSKDFQR